MTSIAFYTPLKAIASVGISAGDVVALAGAGRLAGNWIKAKYFDQSLRELVNAENIVRRKGLVDPAELDRRWSKEIILFENGRILPLQSQDVRHILQKTDYDHFTWLMALVTASLTATTSESCKHWVIIQTLASCIEHDEGQAYLKHDVLRNIESWNSIATTRKILEAGRRSWERLAHSGHHQAGLIPDAEKYELRRFFLWLFGAGEAGTENLIFKTASSDVVALTMVLHDLGLTTLLTGHDENQLLESQLMVVFDTACVAHVPAKILPKRRGMRINMTNPEEVISLWPGDSTQNNRRREIFKSAFSSTKYVSVKPGQLISGSMASRTDFQPLFAFEYTKPHRLMGSVSKFCDAFFIAPSDAVGNALQSLITSWGLSDEKCRNIVDSVTSVNPDSVPPERLADLQIFTLGYYYGLLFPLIDVSRMSLIEAFASWTWNDMELFGILYSARRLHGSDENQNSQSNVVYYERNFIFKISAYLFAGAETEQVRTIRRGCCGLKGKLVLLDRALLGDADNVMKICQFSLLDIDGSCLPGNVQGLLLTGEQKPLQPKFLQETAHREASQISLLPSEADFTSLIEPNWDFDLNECVVTYRHHGRIIHRTNSEAIFNAVVGGSAVSDVYYGDEGQFRRAIECLPVSTTEDSPPMAIPLGLEEFGDEKLPVPILGIGPEQQLCVPTNSLPKIRSCVAAVYNMDTIETLSLANLRQRPVGYGTEALIVNSDWGQVIIK